VNNKIKIRRRDPVNIERELRNQERAARDTRPRQVVLVVRSTNCSPEQMIAQRLAELGPDYRVVSAQTALALHGSTDLVDDQGSFVAFGAAKHVYFVTTLVCER